MLSKDFANAEIELHAGNGKILAYLAGHAEIYRQEYHDNRVLVHCYLPRHLFRHIQEPDVNIKLIEEMQKQPRMEHGANTDQ